MTQTSNVIAGQHDIIVERGTGFVYYLECMIATGGLLDWTNTESIKIDIVDSYGTIVTTFLLNDGLAIELV